MLKKTLIAAAVAVAAGAANAAMILPNFSEGASGSKAGELFLFVGSKTTSDVFVADLGLQYWDIAPTSSFATTAGTTEWSLTNTTAYAAAWSSFASAVAAEDRIWGVLAADAYGNALELPEYKASGVSFTLSTAKTPATTAIQYIKDSATLINNFQGNHNNYGTQTTATNGADYQVAPVTAGQIARVTTGLAASNNLKNNPSGDWGDALAFYNIHQPALSGLTQVAATSYERGLWTLSEDAVTHGVTLAWTVAPVPEPSEWAMMLAGLGVVGAISRRRRKAA